MAVVSKVTANKASFTAPLFSVSGSRQTSGLPSDGIYVLRGPWHELAVMNAPLHSALTSLETSPSSRRWHALKDDTTVEAVIFPVSDDHRTLSPSSLVGPDRRLNEALSLVADNVQALVDVVRELNSRGVNIWRIYVQGRSVASGELVAAVVKSVVAGQPYVTSGDDVERLLEEAAELFKTVRVVSRLMER